MEWLSLVWSLFNSRCEDNRFAHDVKSSIKFIKYLDLYRFEKPFHCEYPLEHIPGARGTNVETESRIVSISDLRGNEELFSLENNGFELYRHISSVDFNEFDKNSEVKEEYLTEVRELLKQRFGPSEIVLFGCERRDNSKDGRHAPGSLLPINQIHIDQTPRAVCRRIEEYFPDQAQDIIAKKRACIVNVWRPTAEPLQDMPLAVVDTKTVKRSDCIETDNVKLDGYVGEDFNVQYSDKHRFYYMSNQRIDECWLLFMAQHDPAKPRAYIQGVPHAAFRLPSDEGCSPRQSVEVRALMIF